MSLLSWLKNSTLIKTLWEFVEPVLIKTAEKNIPKYISRLPENLTKCIQPALDCLFKLKEKIRQTSNKMDDFLFQQGVNALESFANHLLSVVEELRA